jgi:hypothetical protein
VPNKKEECHPFDRCVGVISTQCTPVVRVGWDIHVAALSKAWIMCKNGRKHADVTNAKVYLQTVAKLMFTSVIILTDYCNSINERTYTGFQRLVTTFHCRKLQVLLTVHLCQYVK